MICTPSSWLAPHLTTVPPRSNGTRSCAWGLLALLIVGTAGGCIPGGGGRSVAPGEERALYTVLLDHFQDSARGPLRVDPRPLRPDADLTGVESGDLLAGAETRAGMVASLLRDRGIAEGDAVRDMDCVFSAGVALPPGSPGAAEGAARREACGRRDYTTLAFSEPIPAGPDAPVRVRVVRLTLSSISAWEVDLLYGAGAGWRIARVERVFGITS